MYTEKATWFDDQAIRTALSRETIPDKQQVDDILAKSLQLQGLSFDDAALLCRITSEDALTPVFAAAKEVKEKIYGRRIVLFAPLYISN